MKAICLSLLLLCSGAHAERVRRLVMGKDQIAHVKTAIGVATIIQVPDTPTSLVVGDSSAFKVEFLDQAITIKPLHRGAKSNLYIYTDYRRFDVQLVTVGEPDADYVVYLNNQAPVDRQKIIQKWSAVNLLRSVKDLTIKIVKTSQTQVSGFVEFELTGLKSTDVDPAWFWLSQENKSVPIQRLTLSSFRLTKESPIHGMIEVLKSDLRQNLKLNVEIRRKDKLSITLPRISLW